MAPAKNETLPPGVHAHEAQRIDAGHRVSRRELLAEETPLALVYNELSHAVMMASPLDLEDFALGFSLCEGIALAATDLREIEIVRLPQGIELRIGLAQARFWQLKQRRRHMTGRTGCGLCGVEALDAAIRPIAVVDSAPLVTAAAISQGLLQLEAQQSLNRLTGAVHAAACLGESNALLVREDVGRHNALDKLIGAMAKQAVLPHVLLLSSRASYEMVHKAASANFAIVAAISAPTALAVELAEQAGITLIGFARGERLTIYTHPARVLE
ncbi:formate dehydrogenase accessory sulfurtransferase FdhD [Chitinimonas arctica]|uniref:Sulfur carrier protein FdhD n=2 Tax=Chitinimonas arctica TaxID=2594795 RepID=A0A516SMF4_9NEIS|nr:formate dehydrogenase accessory sulfurtransferase FdhD [Chitinimonas arctica]